jgi:hypothetical protein
MKWELATERARSVPLCVCSPAFRGPCVARRYFSRTRCSSRHGEVIDRLVVSLVDGEAAMQQEIASCRYPIFHTKVENRPQLTRQYFVFLNTFFDERFSADPMIANDKGQLFHNQMLKMIRMKLVTSRLYCLTGVHARESWRIHVDRSVNPRTRS